MTRLSLERETILVRVNGIQGEIAELSRLGAIPFDQFAKGDPFKLAQYHILPFLVRTIPTRVGKTASNFRLRPHPEQLVYNMYKTVYIYTYSCSNGTKRRIARTRQNTGFPLKRQKGLFLIRFALLSGIWNMGREKKGGSASVKLMEVF